MSLDSVLDQLFDISEIITLYSSESYKTDR